MSDRHLGFAPTLVYLPSELNVKDLTLKKRVSRYNQRNPAEFLLPNNRHRSLTFELLELISIESRISDSVNKLGDSLSGAYWMRI